VIALLAIATALRVVGAGASRSNRVDALMAHEGWGVLDAFHMTVITLTTVGFREVRPLDDSGRLFTVSVISSV